MKSVNLKRFIAYMIDIVIVGVVASCISLIPIIDPQHDKYQDTYNEIMNLYQRYEASEITESDYQEQYISYYYDLNYYNLSYTILNVVLLIAYFGVFQWQKNGQTIGKKLMKIKIVANEEDKELGIVSYLIRTIILNNILITILQIVVLLIFNKENYYIIYNNINLVGYILLYLLIFLLLIRKDSRGLHDLLAGSKVVSIEENQNEIIVESKTEKDEKSVKKMKSTKIKK